ncbi:MAG TPA: CPBP family glutamic-type intramembrane protease, partial [Actinomycetota bacterium]|nr:CPBP family glutamic-type intramembrane protease [Actinomycetota bacterium]
MNVALMLLGLVAEGMAWWWISSRGANVWSTMTPVLVGMGLVALLTGRPEVAEDVTPAAAAGVGLAAAGALYLATRAFVAVVAPRWDAFREQSVAMYGRRGWRSIGIVVALSALLMVPGEELFWRGLFLSELQVRLDGVGLAAVLAWAGFLVANAPSRNLAIVAGAAVGGAVWVALAAWSGGVLAGLVCHVGWTVLMLALPPLEAPFP